ncbi:hypothetical protein EMEDMD4_320016 [Sinorhizobium medicae]|uniref:Uncharacterized protein n=1 Tax=Sinorhizobium medicae TaxID=110321 RepID=A0A508WZ27_9HYPH|nr:hypothetical protein EMEDMD4_320016 [Sinorhizobium medicae]
MRRGEAKGIRSICRTRSGRVFVANGRRIVYAELKEPIAPSRAGGRECVRPGRQRGAA